MAVPSSAEQPTRSVSYGQEREPTPVDRLGVWLSAVAVRRHADFTDARFADLGCGYSATFARGQLERARSATLVDVALAPDLARHPKVTAIEGSLAGVLPTLAAESFDVTLCLSVLEHLPDPDATLRELRRITAPGGVLLVNVPTWRGKRALEFAAFRLGVSPADEMNDHKRYYDPKDLWPLLVAAGFRPSDIRCRKHKLGLNTFAVCRVPPREGG
jgi:SAM-dependent methyltransferase